VTAKLEPSSAQRRFSGVLKRPAVKLVTEVQHTFTAVARAAGVSSRSLGAWHAELVPPPAPSGVNSRGRATHCFTLAGVCGERESREWAVKNLRLRAFGD
jgi:hypothetical protein